jgi:SAM-dependent methyltransferase
MSRSEFKDHFSGHAQAYARHRPGYPRELFVYLAETAPARDTAWDCGTGNGQAAVALAEFFERVIATDASAEQIAKARAHPRVRYDATPAHLPALAPASVDLVTAAQALHWFDIDAFFATAHHVLKPNGVIAVWCYGLMRITPNVDGVIEYLYKNIVGPFWPPERMLVDDGYNNLAFPFQELSPPEFHMQAQWTLQGVIDYLGTWSAVRRYWEANGADPVAQINADLAEAWGDPQTPQTVIWPLHLRVGRMPGP